MPFTRVAALLLALAPAAAIPQAQRAPAPVQRERVPISGVTIVERFPHDRTAFTEGLIWQGDALYESVGREGESDVRKVRLSDGRIVARAKIPPAQFGEGLAAWDRELVSLTWHDGIAHRWDAATLTKRGESRFTGEGWGLTSDGRALIQSDGTPTLRFLDPVTLQERRRIGVTLNGRPLDQLNELEWVNGTILANVWHQPFIVRIDPASGAITAIYDLRAIVKEVGASDPEAVANGIAWDARDKRLFVTGKLWSTLFEIKLDR